VSTAYRSFAHRVEIGVPVERVWRAFTDSRVLARWTAAGRHRHAARKGSTARDLRQRMECDALIDVLVTAQRLRLMLLPDARHADPRMRSSSKTFCSSAPVTPLSSAC
jgi:uncharacterized protein YndB with AHSA1/START domain